MLITKQTTENECGICVLASIIKDIYKKDIKEQLLNQANIKNHGLAIFDLELLANNNGIILESYNISFEEFVKTKFDDYLITIININENSHYVIIKKKKEGIIIYDSLKGVWSCSHEEFKKIFSGVIIFYEKKIFNKSVKLTNDKVFSFWDWKYTLTQIGLQTITLITLYFGANYFSIIISNSLNNNVFANCILISFIFFLIFSINVFNDFICTLLSININKQLYFEFSNNFIKKIKYKKTNFLQKINIYDIYHIDLFIKIIANYWSTSVIKFISSIIQIVIGIFIISCVNYYYLLLCLAIIIFISLSVCLKYKSKLNIYGKYFKNNIDNQVILGDMINKIKYANFRINNEIIEYKKNFEEQNKLFNHRTYVDGLLNSFVLIFEKISTIVCICLGIYLISVDTKNFDITNIIFLMFVLGIFINSMISVGDFFLNKIEYEKAISSYSNIVNIGNINDGEIKLEVINNVEIENHKVLKNTKFIMSKYIENFLNKEGNEKILINSIPIEKYDNESYFDKIIFLNDDLLEIDINKISTNEIFLKFIKQFNIDLFTNKKSLLNISLLNIFNCLQYKNKFIYFNNCFQYIKKEYYEFLKKEVIYEIKNNNFVIF